MDLFEISILIAVLSISLPVCIFAVLFYILSFETKTRLLLAIFPITFFTVVGVDITSLSSSSLIRKKRKQKKDSTSKSGDHGEWQRRFVCVGRMIEPKDERKTVRKLFVFFSLFVGICLLLFAEFAFIT